MARNRRRVFAMGKEWQPATGPTPATMQELLTMSYEELVRWADQQLLETPEEELVELVDSCLEPRRRSQVGT